jgi:GPH family glycoside/pentoside/hexuronide:cation symporter
MRAPHPHDMPLGMDTRLSYAMGNVGLQMVTATMGMLLMFFYTDVARVPPAVAGAALVLGKLWDTINDPIVGWLADRSRSRGGRLRTWLNYGAIPLGVSAAAVWMVPPGLSPVAAFVWIALTYTIFDTLMTAVQLPYCALAAELTRSYDARTTLMTWASAGALIGYIGASVLMPMLARVPADATTGYAMVGAALGLAVALSVGIVSWRVPEPVASTEIDAALGTTSSRLWPQLCAALHNHPFVAITAAAALVRLGLTTVQGSLAYFVIYRLSGDKADLPRYMGLMLVMVALSLPLWKRAIERWEKAPTYIAGLVLAAGGLTALYLLNPGQRIGMHTAVAVIGLGMGAHWIAPWSMLPDTVDLGEHRNGARATGIYYGLFGLADKLARTLATAIVALVLELYGYVPQAAQSATALQGIGLMTGLLPAICLGLAVPLLAFYPINRARHDELRRQMRPVT